jgi:uncharacterized phage protein (TIGR02218 family)
MKQTPGNFQEALRKPGTSTCFLIKIVASDDAVYGFTTLDTDVTFNDGIHNVVYDSRQELSPQNIQQEASYAADNTELDGWLEDVTEQIALAGRWDSAELTIYRIMYLRKDLGVEVVGYGTVGEISFSQDGDGKRKVEYRGLTQTLQNKTVPLYSLTCRAAFGDERCGMPFVWQTGTVSVVTDNPHLVFTITGVAQADGFFNLGVIEFLTGQNAGAVLEVETWLTTGAIKLSFLTPYPVEIGDTLRIRQDCLKTEAACLAYGNILNMRAEHLAPVQEKALMVPGAQVKSVGAQ